MKQKKQSIKILAYVMAFMVLFMVSALSVSAAEHTVDANTIMTESIDSQSILFLEMDRGVHDITIEKDDIAITNLEIRTNSAANDVTIKTTLLTEDLTGILTGVIVENIYASVEIEHDNLASAKIDDVKIQFKVEKDWMKAKNVNPNQIKLYRYSNEWDILATTMLSEDATHYYFESNSPGLSYFLVGTASNQPTPQSTMFSEMQGGVYTVNIEKEDIAITSLEITTNSAANDVTIKTTQLAKNLTGILTSVIVENKYATLEIVHDNLASAKIDDVKIQFKVEKDWMKAKNVNPNQIKLYRYSNEWDILATTKISEDATHYYFESNSPGLSYFIIGTDPSIVAPTSTTPTTATTPPADSTAEPEVTGAVIGTTNTLPNWFKISSLIFLFLLLLLIIILATNKKSKKKVLSKQGPSPFGVVRPVETLEGIGPKYKKELAAIGIENTEQLWNANANAIARKTGASLLLVKSWQNMAELSCVEDIGPQYSELLERSGVHNIKQLKTYKPKELLKLVREKQVSLKINIQGNTPGLDLVENWIDEARRINTSYMK